MATQSVFIGSIESFDKSRCDFETYMERFSELCKINKTVITKETKLSFFLTSIGAEAFITLKNLCTPDLPSAKSFDECVVLLKKYFNPKKLVVLERFKFSKREQKNSETISDYNITELKRMARTCDFGAFLNDALRDRFISGLSSK